MDRKSELIENCNKLLNAFKSGDLGQTVMPEDSNPGFSGNQKEKRLSYFTLPMSLNYQRNSYHLWESTLKTYEDKVTRIVFDVGEVSKMSQDELRIKLLKYKVALQPNKHIDTWHRIATTVYENWGSFSGLIEFCENDFLKLKETIQVKYKKEFPYISGPKIFNYWSFILNQYCDANLENSQFIDIAPDTHITKCSLILGVITKKEAGKLNKEEISEKWRQLLDGTDINPIDMHPPLWFWSRNGFIFDLKDH